MAHASSSRVKVFNFQSYKVPFRLPLSVSICRSAFPVSSRSEASHPTGVTVRAGALPRGATEPSPLDNITTDPATPAPAPATAPTPAPATDRPDWCERCGNKGVCDSCKRSHEQAQSQIASTEQWDIPPTATSIPMIIPGPPTGPTPGPPVRAPPASAPAPGVTVRAGSLPRDATEHSPPDNILQSHKHPRRRQPALQC